MPSDALTTTQKRRKDRRIGREIDIGSFLDGDTDWIRRDELDAETYHRHLREAYVERIRAPYMRRIKSGVVMVCC